MDAERSTAGISSALGTLVVKLFGPTFEYFGDELQQLARARVENIRRVLEHAKEKAGPRLERPGSVPPKALKGIIEDASFVEDELSAEYFGGLLASSRSELGRDDRGATLISLVARLSAYQIRSHFIFYSLFKSLFNGRDFGVEGPDRKRMLTYVPILQYAEAMDFSDDEKAVAMSIIPHVMQGLLRERLIDDQFRYGPVEDVAKIFPGATDTAVLVAPSAIGTELFMSAHGMPSPNLSRFLDSDVEFNAKTPIELPIGAQPVHEK